MPSIRQLLILFILLFAPTGTIASIQAVNAEEPVRVFILAGQYWLGSFLEGVPSMRLTLLFFPLLVVLSGCSNPFFDNYNGQTYTKVKFAGSPGASARCPEDR